MAAKVGSIYVQLGLSTATFQRGLQRAASNLQKNVAKMRDRLRSLGRPIKFLTGALGLLGGVTFTALIRSTLESVDALAKQADRLGVSTEALTGYRLAANLAGASNEDLLKGIEKLNRNVGDVASGLATESSTVARAFQSIGVSANELKSMRPEEAFELVLQRLSEIPDAATRTSASMAILGRSGANLGNLIKGGAEGLRAAKEEALALGTAVSRFDAAKIEMANDATTRLKGAFAGFANQLTVQLAPILTAIADKITSMAVEAGGFGNVIENAIGKGVQGFGLMADGLYLIEIAIKTVVAGFFRLNEAVYNGRAAFAEFVASALERIKAIADGLRTVVAAVGQAIESVVNRVGNFIVGMANAVLKKVTEMVNGTINILVDGINSLSDFFGLPSLDRANFSAPDISPLNFKLAGNDAALDSSAEKISTLQRLADGVRASAEGLRVKADESGQKVNDLAEDIVNMINQDLPSDRINKGFEEMKKASDEAAQKIAENAASNQAAIEPVADAVKEVGGAAKSAGSKVKDLAKEAKEAGKEMQDNFANVGQHMSSAFDEFVDKGKISFKGLVTSIARDIAKLSIRNGLRGGGFLGGFLGGIGSLFGLSGARADGGPVKGGSSYLVGERGPEIFTSRTSGTIIPNDALQSAGGGSSKGVTFVENITLQPGVSREELRITLQELERVREEKQRRMISTGEARFAGLIE